MYGFILTTHFNNYNLIKKCLDLLFNNIPDESFIVLYVNETKCNKVLKNQINNYIDFNGMKWTMTIQIDYHRNKPIDDTVVEGEGHLLKLINDQLVNI